MSRMKSFIHCSNQLFIFRHSQINISEAVNVKETLFSLHKYFCSVFFPRSNGPPFFSPYLSLSTFYPCEFGSGNYCDNLENVLHKSDNMKNRNGNKEQQQQRTQETETKTKTKCEMSRKMNVILLLYLTYSANMCTQRIHK